MKKRFLKVLYIAGVIFAILLSFGGAFDEYGTRDFIKDFIIECRGPYTNRLAKFAKKDLGIYISSYPNPYENLSIKDKIKINNFCEISDGNLEILQNQTDSKIEFLIKTNPNSSVNEINNYVNDLRPYWIYESGYLYGGTSTALLYGLIYFVVFFMTFELIKRIFYYIYYGSFFSKNN